MLAGSKYIDGWEPFAKALKWRVLDPFAGLQIGERKSALKAACEELEAGLERARAALQQAGLDLKVDSHCAGARRFCTVVEGTTSIFKGSAFDLTSAVEAERSTT